MDDWSRLDRQFEFIREIDKEKTILRQNYITGEPRTQRHETDSDHAWHLALMTILLGEYANESIDVLRTVTMVLIHDLVEIDAGDTFAYDERAKIGQHEREAAAADRIFGLLPPDQAARLREIWEEFEAQSTPEARFARTMDNLQPLMLNDATNGRAWREHAVRLSQVLGRNSVTGDGSQELWKYAFHHFVQPNVEKGNIIDDN